MKRDQARVEALGETSHGVVLKYAITNRGVIHSQYRS